MMARPNLFNYATSELSQDAFVCWLLDWANVKYSQDDDALHRAGKKFLNALLAKHGEAPVNVPRVVVRRQYEGADIVAVVDDRLVLLIEDKTYTEQHSDQLERYKAKIASKFPQCRLLPIFVKTGEQSNYGAVEKAGYQLFLREDLLSVLRAGQDAGVTNAIYDDFLSYLEELEARVRSWEINLVADWTKDPGWWAWVGFYQKIKCEKKDLVWGYVSNQSGGFFGAWWYEKKWQGRDVYLQIQQGPLCFKIAVNKEEKKDKALCVNLRDGWRTRLNETENRVDVMPLRRPKRSSTGETMTVALVEQSAWLAEKPDGCIDMVATMLNLTKAEELLCAAAAIDG